MADEADRHFLGDRRDHAFLRGNVGDLHGGGRRLRHGEAAALRHLRERLRREARKTSAAAVRNRSTIANPPRRRAPSILRRTRGEATGEGGPAAINCAKRLSDLWPPASQQKVIVWRDHSGSTDFVLSLRVLRL